MWQKEDIDRFFDYNVHPASRTMFMGTDCDEEMAEYFIKGMAILGIKNDPIHILMNNMGGDEYHGLAIYDVIATSPCHVTITVYGSAMSMGSWILQAADERVMAQNATLMLHYGAWGYEDHVKYFRILAKEGERLNALMEETYLERIRQVDKKFPLRKMRKMLEDETYMTAQEALELGLIDKVLHHESDI